MVMSQSKPQPLTDARLHAIFKRRTKYHENLMASLRQNHQVVALLHEMFHDPYSSSNDGPIDDADFQNVDLDEGYLFFILQMIGARLFTREAGSLESSLEAFREYLIKSNALFFPIELIQDVSSDLLLVLDKILTFFSNHEFAKNQDLFHLLYQHLLLPTMKKNLGSYFTPTNLARLMVSNVVVTPQQKVLDPACGTGVFLVETYKRQLQCSENRNVETKLQIFENIHGFDLNPNAVLSTILNLLIQLDGEIDDFFMVPLFVKQNDALQLFDSVKRTANVHLSFDVVIGNPPWKVLNSFHSKPVKQALKRLAKRWNVLPPSHQVSHLEISSLFLEASKHLYLKPNGTVFFVLSHSIITGDNHSKTRRFDELDAIELWLFQDQLFPVPFCCVKARFVPSLYRSLEELLNMKITVRRHGSLEMTTHIPKNDRLVTIQELVPAFVTQNSDGFHVGRFITISERETLAPRGTNPYHSRCFAGATLFPRNLLFVEIDSLTNKQNVEIRPHVKNAKKPWNFDPLSFVKDKTVLVERKFIFPVVTSKEILPFVILTPRLAFLPIEKDSKSGGYRKLSSSDSAAWKYYLFLEELYSKHKKQGAMFECLWDRLNYQQCLTHPRQRAKVRVLIPQSGQLVKAAILEDPDVIVDYTCFLITCENVMEAHYLLGILNSYRMNKMITLIKADRHIQKRPLEFAFPKFDPTSDLHRKIALLGANLRDSIQEFVNNILRKDESMGRITLQRRILKTFGPELTLLDQEVSTLFTIQGK